MIYAQLQMPDTILVQPPPVRWQHYRDLQHTTLVYLSIGIPGLNRLVQLPSNTMLKTHRWSGRRENAAASQ